MQFFWGKVLGSIPCRQQSPICGAKRVDHAGTLKTVTDKIEHRMHCRRFYRIKQAANVIIGRYFENIEQGLCITLPLRLLHRPLKIQKRGALHKKHRKSTQSCIHHRIGRVFNGSPVRECFESRRNCLIVSLKVKAFFSKGALISWSYGESGHHFRRLVS